MNGPRRRAFRQLHVERRLGGTEADEWAGPAARVKDIRVCHEARLRPDDGERRLGQRQGAARVLLARLFRDHPDAVDDVGPFHRRDFAAALRRQKA